MMIFHNTGSANDSVLDSRWSSEDSTDWESDLAGSGNTRFTARKCASPNFTKLPHRGGMKSSPFELEQMNSRDRGSDDRTMEKLSNPNGERACAHARQKCQWCA